MAKTTNYTWNPRTDSVLAETDPSGNVLCTYTNEPSQFGPLISENRGGVITYYHADIIGSTRLMTNSSQAVVDSFLFDAWGITVTSTGATTTPYQWCGRWGYQSDATLLSTYVRGRVYQSSFALWSSVDPLVMTVSPGGFGGVLLYAYAGNSPGGYLDPLGLQQGQAGQFAVNAGALPNSMTANALEMAQLSALAYKNPPPGVSMPADWVLKKPFTRESDGVQAALFFNQKTDTYVLAFGGSESWQDWITDLSNGSGWRTGPYAAAINLAQTEALKIRGTNATLVLTGHSLGAGEAAAAALQNNLKAWTFNGPGLSGNVVAPALMAKAPGLINAINVNGDLLSSMQNEKPSPWYPNIANFVFWEMPDSIGTVYSVDPLLTGPTDPASNHIVLSVVMALMQQQEFGKANPTK